MTITRRVRPPTPAVGFNSPVGVGVAVIGTGTGVTGVTGITAQRRQAELTAAKHPPTAVQLEAHAAPRRRWQLQAVRVIIEEKGRRPTRATPLRWRPSEGLSQRPVRRAVRSVVPLELPGALALLQVRPPLHSCPRGFWVAGVCCVAPHPLFKTSKHQKPGSLRLGAGGFLGSHGAPISIPRALRGVGQGQSLRQILRKAAHAVGERGVGATCTRQRFGVERVTLT